MPTDAQSGGYKKKKPRKVRRAKTKPTGYESNAYVKFKPQPKPARRRPQVASVGDRPATRTKDLRKARVYSKSKKYKATVDAVKPGRKTADANVSNDLRRANAAKDTKAYREIMQDARATTAERQRKTVLSLYKRESPREALAREDKARTTFDKIDGKDVPRTDEEIKRFLKTGDRPTRVGGKAPLAQGIDAGALKVLEQTTRPIHAVAGAADATLSGKNPAKAALRGLQNKDKILFSDVLKRAGAPKIVQSVGGFALDVGLDPVTYATLGTGNLARQAAKQESKRIEKRALKNGMTPAAAQRLGKRAGERAAAKAPEGRGATARFAGKELPGMRRSTGAASRKVRKAGGRAAQTKTGAKAAAVGGGTKNLVRDARPTLTPAGMKREEFAAVHDAAAATRVKSSAAREQAQRLAQAIQKRIPDAADQRLVIDAIERKRIGTLPDRLRQPAIRIRSELRHQRRQAVRSGVAVKNVEKGAKVGDAKGYFPHALDEALSAVDGAKVAIQGVGRRKIKLASAGRREDRRPISAINAEKGAEKFSTDLPLVLANHLSQSGTAAARSSFNRSLADVGREVKISKATQGVSLAKDEALYGIKGGDIRKLSDKDVAKLDAAKPTGERFYAINENLAESELASLRALPEGHQWAKVFDKGNRLFKRGATFTPAFHIRNAIGDTQLAYLSQPGHRLAVNSAQTAKIMAAQRREGRQIDKLEFPKVSGKTIKVDGKRVPVEQMLRESRENGAIQTGMIGRELNDLLDRDASGAIKDVVGGKGPLSRARRAGTKGNRVLQGRENYMRMSTYKHGLDQGKSASKAARISRRTHIDYADLTDFEKQARRLLPFYTFSARSIPLHAEKLITNPGKFAQYQKIREEGAKALGLSPGYEIDQAEFEQRMAAIPIGASKIMSMGLPMPAALNELPTSLNAKAYAAELGDFATSMVTPLIKGIVELQTGKDTFRRRDIEPPNKTLVPAPGWANWGPIKATLGKAGIRVKMIRDSGTGEMVPGWPAKTNYIVRQLLIGPAGQASNLTTKGTNPRGQVQGAEKTASVLSGVKVDRVDASSTRLNELYEEKDKLAKQRGDMKLEVQKLDGENFYTPKYERNLDRDAEITKRIDAINRKNGKPEDAKGKRRVKKTSGGSGAGGNPFLDGGGSSSAPSSSSSSNPFK